VARQYVRPPLSHKKVLAEIAISSAL